MADKFESILKNRVGDHLLVDLWGSILATCKSREKMFSNSRDSLRSKQLFDKASGMPGRSLKRIGKTENVVEILGSGTNHFWLGLVKYMAGENVGDLIFEI